MHDALKRRCLYHWIDYPTMDKEYAIVQTRLPGMDARLARQVVGFVQRLRRTELTKLPGVAETLDWAAALMALGAPALSPEVIDPTLGVLLKYQEDVRADLEATSGRYLAEVQAEVDRTDPLGRSGALAGGLRMPPPVVSGPAFLGASVLSWASDGS